MKTTNRRYALLATRRAAIFIALIAIATIAITGCKGDEPAATAETFTITFNANGGSPTPDPQTVEKGKTAKEPAGAQAPTKALYDFIGWYKEEALTNQWIFADGNGVAADTVTANITLWAKWALQPDPVKKDFPVSFDFQMADGSAIREAIIQDLRTNCGSQNLEQIEVNGKNIVTIIEEAIMGAFNTTAINTLQKNRFRNVFGREGGVTMYVENTATAYKMKATDNQTIYFHIDYLKSSSNIQQNIFDAIAAMAVSTTVYPWNAE